MSTVLDTVEMLMDESPAEGQKTPYYGKAVNLSMEKYYFHEQASFDDDYVEGVMSTPSDLLKDL